VASISSVITGGFGVSAPLIITDGFGTEGVFIPPVVQDEPTGFRRSRFLRLSSKDYPRLPWEVADEPEAEVHIAPAKRKRIQLPPVKVQKDLGPIPIQTVREISAPAITIPSVGTAVLDDDDDDLMLWLI
jgi:hypothetical protein